jgi:hypothetical protein
MRSEDKYHHPAIKEREVFAVKSNRRMKLIAAVFASVILTGVFAAQAQAQSVRFRVSEERHVVAQRPVYVGQVIVVRRQRVYTYRYPRYHHRYYRPYYRHHHGVRVWIR